MTLEELKTERPDLIELFESMDREQLLQQIYKESLDAINMEERVQVFMNECTNGMSKTNYTPEVIKGLISSKQQSDISDFCKIALDDMQGMDLIEVRDYLQTEIIK